MSNYDTQYQQPPPPYPGGGGQATAPPAGWNVPPQQQPYNPYPAGQQAPYQPAYNQQSGIAYPPPQQPVYNSGPQYGEYGGMGPGGEQIPKDDYGLSFSDKSIRRGFIRKVFGMLTIQLLVVLGMIALFLFEENCNLFVKQNQWVYWISYVVFLVTYIALMCCPSVRRSFPTNYICTAILTFAIGYMTAMISAFYKTEIVFLAMAICTGCCFCIILFSMQTKYDFTKWIGVIFVISICIFLFGILAVVIAMFTSVKILYLVYAFLAGGLFMVYLAIDVQMIMGGKKHEYSAEDHVAASIQLFLDIIYIFWFILQIAGYCSGD